MNAAYAESPRSPTSETFIPLQLLPETTLENLELNLKITSAAYTAFDQLQETEILQTSNTLSEFEMTLLSLEEPIISKDDKKIIYSIMLHTQIFEAFCENPSKVDIGICIFTYLSYARAKYQKVLFHHK